jgi:hypothetical protein
LLNGFQQWQGQCVDARLRKAVEAKCGHGVRLIATGTSGINLTPATHAAQGGKESERPIGFIMAGAAADRIGFD